MSGTDKNATVSATSDRLFLLSYSEIFPNSGWISGFPWLYSEGTQYEAFKDKVTENNSDNSAIDYGRNWWLRSPCPYGPGYFVCVRRGDGVACASLATNSQYVCLAWCF